jgi:uncharacterized protein (DUF2235 family)
LRVTASTSPARARPNRQLILCFDGTNNNLTGGHQDTNVVKLCKLLAPSPGRQLVFYDPGVGGPGNLPGAITADKIRNALERLWGLTLGEGLYENIAEAYLFLMRNWQPEDDIYVFGFSRGAFTARSLAGMVARFGILRPSLEGMVPTLLHLYFADERPGHYRDIVDQIQQDFCTPEGAKARVWFAGVWDTVDSVGSPFAQRRIKASGTIIGKRLDHVRQALALDEHRRSFEHRPYYIHPTHDYSSTGQSIDQRWFSGAHCDVGGGYAARAAEMSDHAFLWMLKEAWSLGLQVKPALYTGDVLDLEKAAKAIRRDADGAPPRTPLVHTETFANAYWALSGLGVRDYTKAAGHDGDPPPKPPVQHPVPGSHPLELPLDAASLRVRVLRVLVTLAVGLTFWLLHGAAISGHTLLEGITWGSDVRDLGSNVAQISDANFTLARWQLTWLNGGPDALAQLPTGWPRHPILMVLMDLCFILCYGYLLALGLARGFARWAGLRDVTDPPPVLLNWLGWSGTLIVLADVVEDALMMLLLAAAWLQWDLIRDALACLMTLAAAIKWATFIPAALLIARGLLRARSTSSSTQRLIAPK